MADTTGSSAPATRSPGTFSMRGVRRAASSPTASAQPSVPPVRPSSDLSCRAARWPRIMPRLDLAALMIASSMALPAIRRLSARTTRQPATAATSVVPPPTSTTNPPAPALRSNPAPAAAATGSSTSSTTHRGRRVPKAATTDRRSTQVAPPGTHTSARRLNGPAQRARLAQEAVQHLRGGVQVGDHAVAQRVDDPDVLGLLVRERLGRGADGGHRRRSLSSTAIVDGSSSTRPRPSTQTSVLTVPRSIATLPLLSILGHP